MKPNLSDKYILLNFINKNKKIIQINPIHDNNIMFFNFLFISVLIIFILLLIFRYLDKIKNKKNNIIITDKPLFF